MRILLACIFLGFLPFGCGVWAASQHYKSEVEAKHIKSLAQLGPEKDCDEFKGQPKKFAACFGYE